MTLLIVDDLATNRKLLRVTLEAEGHTALEAADGVEALQILAHETVDAVISDILMPNMDGFRLCHEIRKSGRLHALPFIIYTSTYTSPGDMKLAQTVGADKYLTKPAPIADMLNALREVMDKKAVRPVPSAPAVEETYVLQQYSQALVNNWDLYVDDPTDGISPNGNQGNYTAQQSSLDNCEIRTIDYPNTGTWRWKAWPQNIGVFSNVKMGVTVTFEFDTAHCNPTFTLTAGATYAQPNQSVNVSAVATNYDGLASGVSLDMYTGANLSQATGGLFDGSATNYIGNVASGRQVELGDIPPYYARQCDWLMSWPSEGVQAVTAYCDIDNYNGGSYIVRQAFVTVDGTPPPLPTGFGSFTHSTGLWSENPLIYMSWNLPHDNLSGLQGYAMGAASGYAPDPGYSMTMGNVATAAVTAPSSNTPLYITLRDVDNANNWNGGYVWNGPYYIDAIAPTGPTGLYSTSHAVGGSSCDTTVDIVWNAALDYESYIAGYTVVWDASRGILLSGPARSVR